MKVLILLAVLGSALALQAPVEYEYKYQARVGAGVQSSRPQYSGTGLKATVKVTVEEEGEGTIEFKDVQVGEKNQVLGDNGRAEMPIEYKPIEDKALELPFKAHFRNKDGQTVLEVPDNDLLWVTNVRRGLANMFRIAPLIDPSSVRPPQSGDVLEPQAFSRIEDTYAGRCKVGYTITPASNYDMTHEPSEDIQERTARKGPGGRQVKLDDHKYRVHSSIDFSTCSDRVVLMQTGSGNLTNVTDTMYKDVSTRAAVSQHIIKGSPGKFRIECAVLEHQLVLNPFGIESDKMLVFSNQTLTLQAARLTPGRARRPMPRMKQVDTWRHQLQSPHDKPAGYSPRWITYKKENNDEFKPIFYERMSTGFKLTDALQDSIKKRVEDKLHRAVDRLKRQNKDNVNEPKDFRGTEDGLAAQALMDAHRLIRTLRSDKLRQLDQELKKDRSCDICSKLFTEALAVAGSGPSIDLLLEKISNREVPDNKTAQIFFNIANNIHSPEVVEKLMKFAMSLDEKNRVLVSLLTKVNLSLLLRRLCVLPHVQSYSHMRYMYGSKMCDKSKIVQEYLPHLEAKITGDNALWVKILNVIAAGDLGLKESLDILEKVARGEIDHDRFLRYSAIHSMSSMNFDNHSEDRIFNILQPIAESEVEDFRIRQVAYVSLLTFKPNATFLQRMVFSARQEPSTQIKSFIYWIIHRLGKIDDPSFRPLSSVARNLHSFTQYISPSKYHAMNYLSGRYIHQDLIGSITDAAWLAGYTENFPREVYGFVSGKYGRFNIPLLETVTFGNTAEVEGKLLQWLESYTNPGLDISSERKAHRQRIQQHFDNIKREQSFKRTEDKIADLYHYSRMWRTSEVFLPLTDDLYSKMARTVKNFMKKLKTKQRVAMHRYFNPVEVHVILPLPAGLFMHVEVNTPTILYADVDMEVAAPGNSQDLPVLRSLNISADGIVKAVTKLNTHAYIFGPWTNKTVMAAVDNEKSFSLPMKYEIATNLREPSQILWGELTPKFNQSSEKVPVIKIRNVPYTALSKKVLLPSPEHPDDFDNLKKVQWVYDDSQLVQITVPISKKYTGLNAEVRYSGEPVPPMRQPNFYDYIYEPSRLLALLASPTIKNYDITVYRNPGDSETKKIGFALRHLIENGKGEAIKVPESAKRPIDVSADDTLEQRQQKLQQLADKKVHEYSLMLNFTGAKIKKYEVAIIMTEEMNRKEEHQVDDYFRKIQFAYLEKNDESDHKPKTCVVFATERPQLLPTANIADLVKASKDNYLVGKIATDIFEGSQCSPSTEPIAESVAHLTVTDNRLQAIMNVTNNGDFQYSESNEFFRLAVYDQLSLDVKWKEPSMTLKNITHRVKDLAEGYLFPKIVKNNFVTNENNKMTVSADRSISDDRVDAWIKLPKETCHAEQVNIQPWFDYMTGFTPDEANNPSHSRVNAEASIRPRDKCLLSKDKVTTYDGVMYNKLTSPCPVMATLLKAGDDELVVLISDEESPTTVKISSVKDAMDIRVTGRKILVNDREIPESVNDEEFKDESGNVLAKITRRSSLVTADLPNKLRVDIKRDSEVSIKSHRRFRNSAVGLCGDFDGEAQFDMRSSDGCIYKETMGDIYTASWVVAKDECQDSETREMMDRSKEYEENCDKASGEYHSMSASDSNCKFDAYPVYKFGSMICVSKDQITECTTSCLATRRVSKELMSKCWPAGQAPAEVKQYLSRGYVTERVDELGHMETFKSYEVPEDCRDRLMNHQSQRYPSQQWAGQDYNDRASEDRQSGDYTEDYQQYGDKQQPSHQYTEDYQQYGDKQQPSHQYTEDYQQYGDKLQASRQSSQYEDKAHDDYEGDDQEVDRARQQQSHHRRGYSQVQSSSDDSDDCYVDGYAVKRSGPTLCTTETSERFCKRECNVQDSRPKQLHFKCWREDEAPEDVKRAERDGYSEKKCPEEGQFQQDLVIQVPRRCISSRH